MLAPLQPDFVSVTYGAGGTTRKLTHDAVSDHPPQLRAERGGASDLRRCHAAPKRLKLPRPMPRPGVTEIVALRGDAPKGADRFAPHPDGFANSVELVAALAETGKFNLRVGAYPERHPDAADSRCRCDVAEAQDRRRCHQRHHPVLLRGRHLLALPRCLCARRASPRRSFPASCRSQLGGRQALCRPLRRAWCRSGWTRPFTSRDPRRARRAAGADPMHHAVRPG